MRHERFPVSSDLLELLLRFEKKAGLESLASELGKDPSVISRNLQRLAETLPVLNKVDRKWAITELGEKVNALTRNYLNELEAVIRTSDTTRPAAGSRFAHAALIVINAQRGLFDAGADREATEAEVNALLLLEKFRRTERAVIHVKHVSEAPESRFYRESLGAKFLPLLAPEEGEGTLDKERASAFSETGLLNTLTEKFIDTLILVGFTTNECIDATARDACALGFKTIVISDATATFDVLGPEGKTQKADRVHRLVLEHLRALYAQVLSTDELLKIC